MRAEAITGDAGLGEAVYWIAPASRRAAPALSFAASFGVELAGGWRASVRGRAVFGLESSHRNLSGLGPDLELRAGRWFAGGGAQLTRVRGAVGTLRRLESIGIALELRAGVRVGPLRLAAHAAPVWVLQGGGRPDDADLRAAIDIGLSIGFAL